ncbi:unnamed protein product, partial [Oppiella nova]
MLRWIIQRDIIAIPKTSKTHRLQENINIFDFQLTDEEMGKIFALNKNKRIITVDMSVDHREYPFAIPYRRTIRRQLGNIRFQLYTQIPSINLVDGRKIPIIGLGTYALTDQQEVMDRVINDAFDIGYRHIDTAYVYQNEELIGRTLKKMFESNKTKREDLFITSKVWNTYHKRSQVVEAMKFSLNMLGIEYLDLALVHWPVAWRSGTGSLRPLDQNNKTQNVDI